MITLPFFVSTMLWGTNSSTASSKLVWGKELSAVPLVAAAVMQDENRDAYLQLSVTILSTFCRVNEIASSKEMVMKVPMILEVISKGSCLPGVVQECYDFLLLVLRPSEAGVMKLCECGGIKVLTFQISDGYESLKQAIELVKLVIAKLSIEKIKNEYPRELAGLVAAMAKQFAMLHNHLKFELLQLLSVILSS